MNTQAHTNPALASTTTAESLVALVRLLARQAAREVMEAGVSNELLGDEIPIEEPESKT